MKRSLLLFAVLVASLANAQITEQHHYEAKKLSAILVASGEVVYHTADVNLGVAIYNQSHQLITEVPAFSPGVGWLPYTNVSYMSRKTFDTDNDLEFVCSFYKNTGGQYSYMYYILNQDGSVLKQLDSCNYLVIMGNKMITQHTYNAPVHTDTKVWSLPGSLPTGKTQPEADEELPNAWPNPATTEIQLPYLATQPATLVVVSMNGQEVHRALVSPGSGSYRLRTQQLAPGSYLYYTDQGGQRSTARPFVVQ